MCVYNHERFIAQAIESILKQQTNFKYLLIIGEDCSTDKSKEIIQHYLSQFPEKMKVIFHTKNVGVHENSRILFNECRSKYIALCDGDDYWSDENKLQKQVDFLEANEHFSICGTNYITVENNLMTEILRNDSNRLLIGNFKDIVRSNMIPTLTSVFRGSALNDSILRNIVNMPYSDWILWASILNSSKSNFALLPDITSVQNIHDKGAFSSIKDKSIMVLNELKTKIKMFKISSLSNKRIVSKDLYNFYLTNENYLKGNKNRLYKAFFYLCSHLC